MIAPTYCFHNYNVLSSSVHLLLAVLFKKFFNFQTFMQVLFGNTKFSENVPRLYAIEPEMGKQVSVVNIPHDS